MKASRLQLLLFSLAVIIIVVLLIWVQLSSRRELEELRMKAASIQLNTFRFADHVKATVLGLNDMLLRFDFLEKEADQLRFREESDGLKAWISSQAPLLSSVHERALATQIQSGFDAYVSIARRIMTESANTPGSRVPEVFALSDKHSASLIQLCDQLAHAHRDMLSGFIREMEQNLVTLEGLLAVRLVVSLALATALATLVYRGMIAPMRTQLIESEVIIQRQQKLSALGVLAAGVAHEIRNPLTAIKVRLHGLRRTVTPDRSILEDFKVVNDEISRLENIIRDFLQFARPGEPELEEIESGRLLSEIHNLMNSDLVRSGIELELRIDDTAPVLVDPRQIKQVLINLVRNAAESIPGKGSVVLASRTGHAPLRGRRQPVVLLEVKDNGKGIPPEVQKRLFEPFFTTKETGTGLGLSIAVRILETHQGALGFQTTVNQGSTFTVILPRARLHET